MEEEKTVLTPEPKQEDNLFVEVLKNVGVQLVISFVSVLLKRAWR